jgi:hypothetical protein
MSSTATEAVKFSNISATTAAFELRGGKYAIFANATGSGTMGLQMLGPDGTTFIAVHTTFSAVAGFVVVDLPPGQYKFVVATFTAIYIGVCRIPA